jgi:hypothetical protein
VLVIKQGATKRHVWVYCEPDGVTPIPLTGLKARLQVRVDYAATPTLNLDSATPGLHSYLAVEPLDADDAPLVGEIHLYLGATVTAALVAGDLGVGDLELYDPTDTDEVEFLLQETVTVVEDMTRPTP